MESLGWPSTLLDNLFCAISLVLEMGHLSIPVVNLIWDGVMGHDLLHKWSGDSGSEEADEDIVICDTGMGGITLEGRDVTFEGQR